MDLEDAHGIGIGEHQRGSVLVHHTLQRANVQHAEIVRRDVGHLVSCHSDRRRVGAVRGIRHNHGSTWISAGVQHGSDQQHAGQFPMRARRGLEGHRIHTSDLKKRPLQLREDFHRALRERLRLVRMNPTQAFRASDQFVDARVVLHGAGAERVHSQVDRVVPSGEAREVADRIHFAHFRKASDLGAHIPGAEHLGEIDSGHVQCG